MKRQTILSIAAVFLVVFTGCSDSSSTREKAAGLSKEEVALLKKELHEQEAHYDADKKMIWSVTKEKHYHSDLDSGIRVHDTRSSAQYAAALMHTGDPLYMQRGIDIVKAILPLQEKDTSQPFCGIWPYYPEDPLRGRKAPVDYNWADFMAVYLVDIAINFPDQLDKELKEQLKEALILAARAIRKRDVKADYTNVCIMGIYVCYVVGDLYKEPGISSYARNKLVYFYQYTKENKGFTEYNSPTYTIVAMNELLRLKKAQIDPRDSEMVDELYTMGWNMILRHFHQPSGQWCGPNLRAYNDLLTPDLKQLFFYASKGKIDLPGDYPRQPKVLEPHEIPAAMIPGFLQQVLPRVEIDTFTVGRLQPRNQAVYPDGQLLAKDIVGKLYAQPQYALASVNQGYLWNQCRPLMAHWGSPEKPAYLRVRFLHDLYDFSAVHIKSVQDSSSVLSILNVACNGGDRHPGIDRIKDSTISATDLRLRIETGGTVDASVFSTIDKEKKQLLLVSGSLRLVIQLPYVGWDGLSGHWEMGAAGDKKWADYVIYSGRRKTFGLASMREAVMGLAISVSAGRNAPAAQAVKVATDDKYLRLSCNGLDLRALKKPDDEFRIKNDFDIYSK